MSWLSLLVALVCVNFLESVAIAEQQACHLPDITTIPRATDATFDSITQTMRTASCQQFDPSFQGMEKGSDSLCGEFGLDAGDKVTDFSNALSLDCAVMRFYQPRTLQSNDPLVDLSIACNIEYAKKRLKNKLLRNQTAEHELAIMDQRARACAARAFDLPPTIPFDFVSAETANPWSNFENDLEIIRSTNLSDENQARATQALTERKLKVEGFERPVRPQAMAEAFSAVMNQESQDHGMTPTPGEPIQWSKEFEGCVGKKFAPLTKFSRTLSVLAIGMGMYHTPTGKEGDLYNWMMAQADGSVEPAALFRQALRLNQGDVYRTLLSIENLLSRAWLLPDRDRLAQTRKLRPFTRTIGPAADTYGSWYHLFGTMLHGYSSNLASALPVSVMEGVGSVILSGQVEVQEGKIGRAGALVGANLRRSMTNSSWRRTPLSSEDSALDFDHYINTSAGLERRIERRIDNER